MGLSLLPESSYERQGHRNLGLEVEVVYNCLDKRDGKQQHFLALIVLLLLLLLVVLMLRLLLMLQLIQMNQIFGWLLAIIGMMTELNCLMMMLQLF